MTGIVIFRGPTLPEAMARATLDATYLPPAAQGDVYRAERGSPRVIGIIDGTFERTPAIWHKEVLWALAQGVHVFGAASMGALRASELSAFGMEGVGRIFEWFRDGTLEDDDEVAVAHADASLDYRPVSEAMVNIRATVESALSAAVVPPEAARVLLAAAKSLYYPERSYPALLVAARDAGLSPELLAAFSAFLQHGQVNQKRLDAVCLLEQIRGSAQRLSVPKRVSWAFEHTDAWDQVADRLSKAETPERSFVSSEGALLQEELRLDPRLFEFVTRGALLRTLAREASQRSGYVVTPELRDLTQDAFRRERGLEDSQAIWDFLARHRLSEVDFGRFLEGESRLRWLRTLYSASDGQELAAELVASGAYEAVQRRALEKQRLLSERGLQDPELSDAGLEFPALLAWYFEERMGSRMPSDLVSYLRSVGLSNAQELAREALREYLFLKFKDEEPWPLSDPEAR